MNTPGECPRGPRPDWGTVSRWVDAGKPPLNPDGSWDHPALAAAPASTRQTTYSAPRKAS